MLVLIVNKIYLFEISFIVKKAKNFSIDERTETVYRWSQKHQERSPIFLKSGIKVVNDLITHNCEVIKTHLNIKILKTLNLA